MNCLAIGDLHYKETNSRSTSLFEEKIKGVIEETQPDMVVILGDSIDRINVIALSRCISFFDQLTSYYLGPVFVLIGNHDIKSNVTFLTGEHPFTAVKNWERNITIVDQPLIAAVKGMRFSFVPYVYPGRFSEALSLIPEWRSTYVIFCHQEFYGVKLGPLSSTIGDKWSRDFPPVISGHIHSYQVLEDVNIYYTGTPYQHTFGENDDKSVSLFTFSPSGIEEKRIFLHIPVKRTVRITAEQLNDFPLEKVDYNTRVIITGSDAEITAIRKCKHHKVKEMRELGAKVDVFTPIAAVTPQCERKDRTFDEILLEKLEGDPELKKLANEVLFS